MTYKDLIKEQEDRILEHKIALNKMYKEYIKELEGKLIFITYIDGYESEEREGIVVGSKLYGIEKESYHFLKSIDLYELYINNNLSIEEIEKIEGVENSTIPTIIKAIKLLEEV